MGQITIHNPDISVRFEIDGVKYHIGKNFAYPSTQQYAWNIYRTTDQKYHIGIIRMYRNTTNEHGGKSVMVTVWKETEQIHKCWISVGLLKNKETLIGVVRGCILMSQI